MKKPGAVSRPGTLREFQFHESTDLGAGVKRELCDQQTSLQAAPAHRKRVQQVEGIQAHRNSTPQIGPRAIPREFVPWRLSDTARPLAAPSIMDSIRNLAP
jgi:hypothetical protein